MLNQSYVTNSLYFSKEFCGKKSLDNKKYLKSVELEKNVANGVAFFSWGSEERLQHL
jgi:hypothetical protein